ncbi:MAG: hypothetical protein AB7P34_15165 [Vicinamibacterales bacterium]
MSISVCRLCASICLIALGVAGSATEAGAQYRGAGPAPVTGEEYHIEAAYAWWDAQPSLIVNSESIDILGTDVNLIEDLGIEKHKLGKLDLVLRPAKKHRFRFQRLPIHYEADGVVQRSFIFNGQSFNVGLPVQTVANFDTYRFGYEYDFLYSSRGFLGAMVDVKYTNVEVELKSPIGEEFTRAAAPIPTFGFIGRVYPLPNLAVTSELSFFRVPDSLAEQLEGDGSYTDFDVNVTYNFNRFIGAQAGYRRVNIFYDVDLDSGTLKFTGLYFGGVVRY